MAINKRINAKNSQNSIKKTKANRNDRYDLDALKARLLDDDAALDVFALAGVPSELIEHARQTGRERGAGAPCPICKEGTNRFSLIRAKDGGQWIAHCRHCGRSYSPLDFYMTARGLDLNAAVREIVDALDGSNVNAMRMTKNDVVIQSAPPITAKPSARSQDDHAPGTSKKGLRVLPERDAEKRTIDYIYRDENGAPVFNARRVDFYDRTTGERVAIDRDGATVDKSILSLVPNGAGGWKPSKGLDRATIPPYNAPELFAPACQCVYIVEGEKSAERLKRALAGYEGERVATTTGATSNAGHWRQWAPRVLSGKGVFVLADHDAPGRKAAETIAEAAAPFAAGNVQIIDFETRPDETPAPAGYDVADYLDDLERVDPSAIASNYLDALAVPFTPSAFPLQRETGGAPVMANAEELDADEELNRAAIAARLKREQDIDQEQLENELALYTRDFPSDVVPDCLNKHASSYAERFNLPKASVVFTQLATIGAFLGSKLTFFDPIVWPDECYAKIGVLGVAPSGGYKSPIYKLCTRPIKEIDEENKTRYQEARKAAKQKRAEIKNARDELKRLEEKIKRRRGDNSPETKAEVDTFRNRIRTLEGIIDAEGSQEASDPPRIPKFLVRGTPEKITNIVALNLRDGHKNGVLTGDDEGIRVINISGGVDKALERFFKYTALLDGKSDDHETVTTESAGDYDVPGEKFAGVLFFIQPGPFARTIRKKDLIDQGFLNRFIKVFIPYSEEDENFYEVKYYQLYKNVFDWALKANAQKFSLSKDARDVFFQWKRQNKRQQNDAHKRNDEAATAFFGKAQILFISFLLSIHVCDFIDGRRNAATIDDDGNPAPTTEIDAETVKRVVKLVDAAIDYTETCNRYLDLSIKRAEEPKKTVKLNDLERRALEIIAGAGTDGATIRQLCARVNALRGRKDSKGGKLAHLILDKLRNAGEIEKHGARYYVATLPELFDDQDGGAE